MARTSSKVSVPVEPFHLVLGCIWGVALIWRLWIGTVYAGWEESDYGNLAMIEGVRAGAFRHYDMNHMPGYYALSAMVHAVVEDARLAGRVVALVGGMGALAGSMWAALRIGGRGAALLTGMWLLLQPEFALYSASTLREPMYCAALMGFVAALTARRSLLAGVCGAIAFSVRFDALLVLGAAAAIHVWGERRPVRALGQIVVPMAIAALLWAVYCKWDHGTFAFWSHAVAVNVETGMGGEAERPIDWLLGGMEVAFGLGGWLLPWRIGWGVWLGALGALVFTPWAKPGALRSLAATALMATGFWISVGFVGQHSPEHNLYWKWMMPLVPLLVPLSAVGWVTVWTRARRFRLGVSLLILAVSVQAMVSHLKESQRQIALSQDLYAPQVELAKWFEQEVDPTVPVVVDNIPACWINRRPHTRELISWFDIPASPDDPDAFGHWLQAQGVPWVLWFREDWTQAPRVAPELRGGGVHMVGPVELVERSREDGYGWILYEVRGDGIAVHDGGAPPTANR